jgi:hypothetical protein
MAQGNMLELKAGSQNDKEKKYLTIFVAAGHGMNISGQQVLLLNEFHASTKFYKTWKLEAAVRGFA